jgi:hypothetical protein
MARCDACGVDFDDPHESHDWSQHPKCPQCSRVTHAAGVVCLTCMRRRSAKPGKYSGPGRTLTWEENEALEIADVWLDEHDGRLC